MAAVLSILRGRFARGVVSSLAGLLLLGLLVTHVSVPAVPAVSAGPMATAISQGARPDREPASLPTLHADGAVLDLDDLTGDVRVVLSAAALDWAPIPREPSAGADRRVDDVEVPLLERPPRA